MNVLAGIGLLVIVGGLVLLMGGAVSSRLEGFFGLGILMVVAPMVLALGVVGVSLITGDYKPGPRLLEGACYRAERKLVLVGKVLVPQIVPVEIRCPS